MHTVLDLPRLKKVPTIHPDFTVKNRILMEDGSIGQACKSITSPGRKIMHIWTNNMGFILNWVFEYTHFGLRNPRQILVVTLRLSELKPSFYKLAAGSLTQRSRIMKLQIYCQRFFQWNQKVNRNLNCMISSNFSHLRIEKCALFSVH